MLFTFVSQKYLRGSLLITSNLAFADWTQVFQDTRLIGALLDRLTHQCHILEFAGESYRFRQSLTRQTEDLTPQPPVAKVTPRAEATPQPEQAPGGQDGRGA